MTNAAFCTSIICPVRNRNERLKTALENWLSFEVPQIIVVDFRDDGCESAWDIVKEINDSRIKLIETKYEYRWIPSIAMNLGVYNSYHEYILRLDVDYILQPNFFDKNIPSYSSFITGCDNLYQEPETYHYYGLIYVGRQFHGCIGGFNENLIYYGHEDGDFVGRLLQMGLHKQLFDHSSLKHIQHDDTCSLESQINKMDMSEQIIGRIKFHTVNVNKAIGELAKWNNQSVRIQWNIQEIESNRYLAIRNVKR